MAPFYRPDSSAATLRCVLAIGKRPRNNPRQDHSCRGFSIFQRFIETAQSRFDLEAAGRFATAGRSGWGATATGVTGVISTVVEQAMQQTFARCCARGFAATSRSNNFATTNRLRIAADRGVTAVVVLVGEQTCQQPGPFGTRVTSLFKATGRSDGASANRGFAATSRFSGTTAIAAAAVMTEQASRSGGRSEGGQGESEHYRGDYTTHRD